MLMLWPAVVSGYILTNRFHSESVRANLADPAHGQHGWRITADFDVSF